MGRKKCARQTPRTVPGTGKITATNTIDITGTFVDGDVKGRNVRIGQGTEISGAVYYIDSIERHQKATLTNEPVQIK